jgi:hypothetical protein
MDARPSTSSRDQVIDLLIDGVQRATLGLLEYEWPRIRLALQRPLRFRGCHTLCQCRRTRAYASTRGLCRPLQTLPRLFVQHSLLSGAQPHILLSFSTLIMNKRTVGTRSVTCAAFVRVVIRKDRIRWKGHQSRK